MEIKKNLLIFLLIISCNKKREEVNISDYPNINSNILYDKKNIDYKLFKINDSIYIKEGYYNKQLVIEDTLKNKSNNFYFDGWSKRIFNKKDSVTYYELLHIDNKSYVNQKISYKNCNINYDNSIYYELDKQNYLLKLNVFKEFVNTTGNDYVFLLLSKDLKNNLNNITNNNLAYDTIYLDSLYKTGAKSNILQFKLNKNDIYKNGYFVFHSYDKNDQLVSNQRLYFKNKSSNTKFECR
ncbi:hypothetical protein F0358_11140 [Empedobacter brevis]|uniref:hypothetical protein n=1 Tax=Empedobacter brevis TaxID=247 RepID=UPI00123C84BE|nr:hypothetical protein [Empedobacter brevis]QES93226.1 hypothetical protein F0358_11140 [Empedobacter brevis]